jgi:predicted transcriptional regulator
MKYFPEDCDAFLYYRDIKSLLVRKLIVEDMDDSYKITDKGLKALSQITENS